MLGLTKYRLREQQPATEVYELVDRESGGLVCVARPAENTAGKGRSRAIWDFLLSFRLSRYCVMAVGLVLTPFWLVGAIFGLWPLQSRASRPRLVVRRAGEGETLFTLRVSSGLLYDSRRVYDGQGRLIAHFRSQSKSSVRGGFEIINLIGCEDDDRDISGRPRFGRLEVSGSGRRVYRLHLADLPDAGLITREGDHYDIDTSAELSQDATKAILVLAAALTIAWSPRG